MGLLDRLRREDRPDVPGDEPPPEAADFPTTDPTTIPPDEGDGDSPQGSNDSYV